MTQPPPSRCDGTPHCPTGLDEGIGACGILWALPWVYLVAACVLVLSVVSLFFAVVIHRIQQCCRRRWGSGKARQQQQGGNAAAHGNGLKSTTQDFLLPPEKEDAW